MNDKGKELLSVLCAETIVETWEFPISPYCIKIYLGTYIIVLKIALSRQM
jgi:hypothetical protein